MSGAEITFNDLACPWVAGLGTYEPGRPIEEVARELGFSDTHDIIKLASNENALGPSPKAMAAIRRASRQMHQYPDGGAYTLRQALSRKLGVPSDSLITGAGSNELIELLGHVFLDRTTNIVVADRAFIAYRLVAAMFRAGVVAVPMIRFTHDLSAMKRAITPKTRMVFIANPNNPTGTMVGQADLDAFMDGIPKHVIVVIDEAYIELLPPRIQPDCIRYVREGRKLIILRTFSKTYGLAGLRIGYAIAPEPCIKLMNKVRQPFNTSAMAQIAAVAALDDDSFVERTRAMTRVGLKQLESAFRRLGIEFVPSSANFILVRVGNGKQIYEAMQRSGVIVRPMNPYGLSEYIRITVGTPRENQRCLAVLKAAVKGVNQ